MQQSRQRHNDDDNFEFDETDLYTDPRAGDDELVHGSDTDSHTDEVVGRLSDVDERANGKEAGDTSNSNTSTTLRASLNEFGESMRQSPAQSIMRRGEPFSNFDANPKLATRLGTSAPIGIPNVGSWRMDDGSGEEAPTKNVSATFIPPHCLSQQDEFMLSLNGASPSAALKRDRLRVRNAILRSTGFIEMNGEAAQTVYASSAQPRMHSRLTQALTTIGEI